MSPRTRRVPVADFTHSAAYVRAQAQMYKISFAALPAHESWASEELALPDTPCHRPIACRLPRSRPESDAAGLGVGETFAQTRIPLEHPGPEDVLVAYENDLEDAEAYEATAFITPTLDTDSDWEHVPQTPRLDPGEWSSNSAEDDSEWQWGHTTAFDAPPPTPRVDAGEWEWEDFPTPRAEPVAYFVCNPDEGDEEEDDVECMILSTPRL